MSSHRRGCSRHLSALAPYRPLREWGRKARKAEQRDGFDRRAADRAIIAEHLDGAWDEDDILPWWMPPQ